MQMLKHYHSTYEMVMDFARLSDKLDAEATLTKAPEFSFITKDGTVHLGGTFIIFLVKIAAATGIKLLPMSSVEMPGAFAISFEDYSVVESQPEEVEKIQAKVIDSPVKKRATRTKATA